MFVYILLYKSDGSSDGIHSIELNGRTIVLMFEDIEDAQRYCGLLEAQDFPLPTVEKISKSEIDSFCSEADYEARFVKKNFIPKTAEDRLLLSPPEKNLDLGVWDEDTDSSNKKIVNTSKDDIEEIKNNLEKLL
tara:strand:+ start:8635 stop:9036 length:402 start_codon:yes stop_codon:yes gene_type:complete